MERIVTMTNEGLDSVMDETEESNNERMRSLIYTTEWYIGS